MKRRRRRKSQFKKAFIIYMSVLSILLLGILTFLWISLFKYQESVDDKQSTADYELQVRRAPQLCFENFYHSLDRDTLIMLWLKEYPDSFSTRKDIEDYIDNSGLLASSCSFYRASDYSTDSPKFIVKANKLPVMEVSLVGQNTDWEISKVHFPLKQETTFNILIPSDSSLSINEKPVNSEYIREEYSVIGPKDYSEALINPVSYSVYQIDEELNEPDIVINTDTSYELLRKSDTEYVYALSSEAGLSYTEKANAFVRSLLRYYTLGKQGTAENMGSTLNKVASDSAASRLIKSSYNGVGWRYPYPDVVYDLSDSPVFVDADNCLHVDIHFSSDSPQAGDVVSKEGSYRIYFLDLGKGYQIYYFELINNPE